MQVSDDLRLGPVYGPATDYTTSGNPAPMELGVGPMGRVYVFDVVPATLGAALLAALQSNQNIVLTAGAGVTTRLRADGTTEYVLDTPRNVTITASGANTATAVVTGYDATGQKMSENFAAPSTSTVAGKKAFKSVVSVVLSGVPGSTVSVGFGDVLGLPYSVIDAGYIGDAKWAGVLAADAGTLVVADGAVATATTGDVRGTYTPSSASNGARRLVMMIALRGVACGPNATRIGALGVNQNLVT